MVDDNKSLISADEDTPAIRAAASEVSMDDIVALKGVRDRIVGQLKKKIVGQEEVIELLLTAIFARGHGLFIGVPGLAKTLLIQSVAETMSAVFNRIQFTPDLMPTDITGTDILEEDQVTGKRAFTFVKGPVFCNILLADEVNRTPPKTQAALLQAMQEGVVTAGGKDYPLQPPFLVFATQNPIEQEGTYPLPEAQLDRFMLSIHVDYPSMEEEIEIVSRTTGLIDEGVGAVVSREELIRFQAVVRAVVVAPDVVRYAVELVNRTRPKSEHASAFVKTYVAWGAGPRASQNLVLGAKARAAMAGRAQVAMEDIRAMAEAVLSHRLCLNYQAEAERVSARDVVAEVVRATPVHASS